MGVVGLLAVWCFVFLALLFAMYLIFMIPVHVRACLSNTNAITAICFAIRSYHTVYVHSGVPGVSRLTRESPVCCR